MSETAGEASYDLIDLASGEIVGRLTASGKVLSASREVEERVARAFRQELMIKDGALVEELGICFADIEVLLPGEPGHAAAVVRNLGRLAGVVPRPRHQDGE